MEAHRGARPWPRRQLNPARKGPLSKRKAELPSRAQIPGPQKQEQIKRLCEATEVWGRLLRGNS